MSEEEKPSETPMELLHKRISALEESMDAVLKALGAMPDTLSATFAQYEKSIDARFKKLASPGEGSGGGLSWLADVAKAIGEIIKGGGENKDSSGKLGDDLVKLILKDAIRVHQKRLGISDHVTVT